MHHALIQGASRGIGLALASTLLSSDPDSRVAVTCRYPARSEGLADLSAGYGDRIRSFPLDVMDEASVEVALQRVSEWAPRLHLVINVAGVLHDETGLAPEKKLEAVDPAHLRRSFEVNAVGPLLVAKHALPLLRHEERSVLANVSARVGSIGDNRAGGWYGYRASKAAQNMFTKNLAIELRRRAPNAIVVALHPGTVDTELSKPFQRGVPPERLFSPERSARQLLAVLDGLRPEDSGSFRAWDGAPIPW